MQKQMLPRISRMARIVRSEEKPAQKLCGKIFLWRFCRAAVSVAKELAVAPLNGNMAPAVRTLNEKGATWWTCNSFMTQF
jgi:hypothetical protein